MPTKKEVVTACNHVLDERTTRLNEAMAASREAANSETKSSAGDKYETTRELMQAEMERLSHQLAEVSKLREALYQAEMAVPTNVISIGSTVKTNHGTYFLAAGLGKITVGAEDVFIISTASPIGQMLLGKRVGEQIVFNGVSQRILALG